VSSGYKWLALGKLLAAQARLPRRPQPPKIADPNWLQGFVVGSSPVKAAKNAEQSAMKSGCIVIALRSLFEHDENRYTLFRIMH
jgi:hypothetical protein